MDAQAGQDFADQGELGPQVVRRGLARRLVAVVEVVAEGMLALIEGDGDVLRVQFTVQFQKHIQKAIDGIRRVPLGIAQMRNGVKSPV